MTYVSQFKWINDAYSDFRNAWVTDLTDRDAISWLYSFIFGAYALLQYKISGIEIALLPLILLRIGRLGTLDKEVIYIFIAGGSLIASAMFNDNFGPACKILILLLFSFLYFQRYRINFLALIAGSLIATIFCDVFFPELLYSGNDELFWFYAANYTAYVFCGSMICCNYGLIPTIPIGIISLSRWMIASVLSSLFSRKIAIAVLLLAYLKLFLFTNDTYGFDLKQISEGARLEQHQVFFDNFHRMVFGLPYKEIVDLVQIKTGTDIDSFESTILNRIAFFGIFSIPLLLMHLRLLLLGGEKRLFLFLYPIFNPLDFTLFYYLFYYCAIKEEEDPKLQQDN